jgi:histidine triad (HIT) family protein
MATECLFCSIVSGAIPATIVTENDGAIAFSDLNPQAPTHFLVVPRLHYDSIVDLAQDSEALRAVMALVADLGSEAGPDGFRLVFNTGPDAGQSVGHVHGHLLAGRKLHWPPG